FLHSLFPLQRRIETAFLSSGAAAQLADAALEGENTRELAGRIAKIARRLSGAEGVAVHLRTGAGLQMLGSDGRPCTAELAARALDSGRVEWGADCAAVPLCVHDQIFGALSILFDGALRDLRPLRPLLTRAAAVLAAAERESRKDRFLSLAAHELKTPLTSIKGFSYSLARRLEKGEACDPRSVQVLERQAERLHALLEEMLEVSRIETSRFVLHQEPCEAVELVEAARRSLRRLGLGMALMIGRRAAELHGGTLRAEARAFVLELPLRSRVPGRSGNKEGRVLVVDDDEPLARMMAEFLAEHGFEADWAGGGRAALAKIKSDPPDVI